MGIMVLYLFVWHGIALEHTELVMAAVELTLELNGLLLSIVGLITET